MKFKFFLPAIAWFIVSTILLCLPGDDLPKNELFNIPFFDKYVHLVMFFLLTSLTGLPFLTLSNYSLLKNRLIIVATMVIIYGIAMEFVQKYFVYARSFDVTDILFDSLGSVAGYLAATWFYTKKIGPNRNRGRNQN